MDHLIGRNLPDIELQATDGRMINPARLAGTSIFFCYPFTGRPNFPNPPDWDNIPGAHGSTPQALAFSMCYGEFKKRGVKVFGLSFQDAAWQKEFVARASLLVPLLSDCEKNFSNALTLPTFRAGAEDYLRRITLIAQNSIIARVRYPIDVPENDADETLGMVS